MTTHIHHSVTGAAAGGCCGPRGLWGWSPPDLPADTTAKQRFDLYLPRTGPGAFLYFAAVAAVANIAHMLGPRLDLLTLTAAGVAGGGWCTVNFWRCRHAHCLITGAGWLALAAFTAVEAGIGHTLVDGDEPIVFVAVLAAGLLFECSWTAIRGTNAIRIRPRQAFPRDDVEQVDQADCATCDPGARYPGRGPSPYATVELWRPASGLRWTVRLRSNRVISRERTGR